MVGLYVVLISRLVSIIIRMFMFEIGLFDELINLVM